MRASSSVTITNLPPEIIRRVVSFATATDALRLGETCQALANATCRRLSCLEVEFAQHSYIEGIVGGVEDGDLPCYGYRLPMYCDGGLYNGRRPQIHSVTFACEWCDQGWGNQKGSVYIRAVPKSRRQRRYREEDIPMYDPPLSFEEGHPVCGSDGVAPHEVTEMHLNFHPSVDSEDYHLWVKVGGGGGHELNVVDIKMQFVIWEEEDRPLLRTFRTLNQMGLLFQGECSATHAHELFYPQMLIAVARYFTGSNNDGGNNQGNAVMDLLTAHSITNQDLSTVATVIEADMDWREQMAVTRHVRRIVSQMVPLHWDDDSMIDDDDWTAMS